MRYNVPLRVLKLVLCMVFLAGCGEKVSGPILDLGNARDQWTRHGPLNYTMTIRLSCECGPEIIGPTVVEVRGGSVSSRTYQASGAAVPELYQSAFPTVEELFRLADIAVRNQTISEVTYNSSLGYPERMRIDNGFFWIYTVTNFRAD
jgi:hypothetical protein